MRIAVLNNTKEGGAYRIAETQARLLRERGDEVCVWCPEVAWFSSNILVRLWHHALDGRPRRKVVGDILGWKPDILLSHNLTGCGFGTPEAIQRRGVKWAHVLHDVQLFEPSGQLVSAARVTCWQRAWSRIRRNALGQPDLVISPTRWLLNEHGRRGFFKQTQTVVIPNPGPSVERHERMRHDPLRLLFVGRVADDKGTNILAGLIHELGLPCELRVIGDGPEIDDLKALGPSVVCDGVQPADGVRERMREADVLLVPSQIEENQPTVILEAASVGLPVIAADKGGIPETLGEAGMVCKANELEPWKTAVLSLASDADRYARVSASMFACAQEHDPSVHADRLREALQSLGRF